MMTIAVFASGKGSNFDAIVRAVKRGACAVRIGLLVCDQPSAGVLKKAKRHKVPIALVRREDFSSKSDFEKKIIEECQSAGATLIVLAGFMRIVGADLISAYKDRIINIHPALLPSFKGAHGIRDAFEHGVKVTGVTVHFVDEAMDNGPVILQASVAVNEDDTLKTLEEKIHKIEHKIYPKAIALIAAGAVSIKGRKVSVSRP